MAPLFKCILALCCKYPLRTLVLLAGLFWLMPTATPRIQETDKTIKVEGGFTYAKSPAISLDIYPFMVQRYFLGMPGASGVSSSIYYVTKLDLERAKKHYEKKGGCWPSTFSSYKRELMIVGKDRLLKKFVKHEGPPPFYGDVSFVRVNGQKLRLAVNGQDEDIASQIAATRNSDFFLLKSAITAF